MKFVTPIPKPPPREKAPRKRMRQIGKKTAKERPARKATVDAVIARDKVCQFFPMLWAYVNTSTDPHYRLGALLTTLPPCDKGHLVVDETGHRRNDGRIGMKGKIALCALHNTLKEDAVGFARETFEAAGLIRRANGDPIRKYGYDEPEAVR